MVTLCERGLPGVLCAVAINAREALPHHSYSLLLCPGAQTMAFGGSSQVWVLSAAFWAFFLVSEAPDLPPTCPPTMSLGRSCTMQSKSFYDFRQAQLPQGISKIPSSVPTDISQVDCTKLPNPQRTYGVIRNHNATGHLSAHPWSQIKQSRTFRMQLGLKCEEAGMEMSLRRSL